MKKSLILLIIMSLLLALPGCSRATRSVDLKLSGKKIDPVYPSGSLLMSGNLAEAVHDVPTDDGLETDPEESTYESEAPETDPPGTEPPATLPPQTDPPVTKPTETQPPETRPRQTNAPETTAPVTTAAMPHTPENVAHIEILTPPDKTDYDQ